MREARVENSTVYKNHKSLSVWQRSFVLVKTLYALTSNFPQDEKYGLISQIRRASVSIPTNIAEGYGRFSRNEYAQFVSISHGSASELDTLVMLAYELNYISVSEKEKLLNEIDEISRMLNALRQKLKA